VSPAELRASRPRATPRPETIRARLAHLKEAGARLRRQPAERCVAALARILDRVHAPASPQRLALERELPGATGFSAEVVREGLGLALGSWNGDALLALVDRELGGVSRLDAGAEGSVCGFDVTSVLLAGAIPMPTLLSLLAPLVLRSPVLAKCAAGDPVTAHHVARWLREVDAELADCLEVLDFPGGDAACTEAFLEASCIVATGSDETVQQVRDRVRGARHLVLHGHRFSAAALGPEALGSATLAGVAARLANDVALWDQLGCLSPVSVYTTQPGPVAEALADALAATAVRLPRGQVPLEALALTTHERDASRMRAAAGHAVKLFEGEEWTVLSEADAVPRPAPLYRFVRVHPVRDAADVALALRPVARHLAAVATEGFGAHSAELERTLTGLGASRVCRAGELQAPPLGWPRDGLPVLASLARPGTA